ncbi:MAG: response regulator [Treponema sp.]|jgi:PAS domain S-box-containing protein|nr:response regulator [Treponema sp.]
MNPLSQITKETKIRCGQAFLVLLAFALMVVSSYIFLSVTERNHLSKLAENAIRSTETNIKSDMLELETLLGVVSETINDMIIKGDDINTVNEYILFINNYIETGSERRLHGTAGVFGFFNVFGGEILTGYERWIPPDDYLQTDRPWYTGAVRAAGHIDTSEPYLNVYSDKITITLSRSIFDMDGNALGIVCLNIELDRIGEYAVNTQFVEGGYGFLLSNKYMVIAHPDPDIVGMSFSDVKSGIAAYIDDFGRYGDISEMTETDYKGVLSIVFVKKFYNGWYMGVVTPRNNYFQSTRNLAFILIALGAIFAFLLLSLLLKISGEKAMTDERMKLMFDATPLVAYIFNKDYRVIDCNQNAVLLFDLSSKEEFCSRFYDLLPEYQPNGRLTAEAGTEFNRKILEEGSCRFEWTYRKLNGEPVPCEITCTRVMYKNEFTIVGYMRDMREQKKMVAELEYHARLLDTVNTAAAILLASNDMETFEHSLLKCFDLIGHCLDVDRVQIWRNEVFESEPHFVLRYEWLSDYGKDCRSIPMGQHFPYSMKKEWAQKFIHHEHINAPVCELPEEDKAFLGYYDIKSIVILPMFLEGDFWGFFSIDDCRRERTFSEEEINILTSAGLMMSSAVNRNIQTLIMRENEERTRIMFDAAPICAIFWDKNLNITDCNQEAVKMFGLSSKQEFIEKFITLSPVYQPDGSPSGEKGFKHVKQALDEGYSRFEWMHQRPDGESIPADVTCIRVKHKKEFVVTEYIRDLREQRAMIAEMRKAEIAEESSKAKSDFLAKMSHEIRTPMNAILGITEIQLQDSSHRQITKEAFERIYNSGDLLLGIINDILDLSKIEAGKLILMPAQYDIASLIHDTVQLNKMRYETKPIEFILNVNEDIPLFLIGDELRIKQILNNILSNAFKYTDEGTVSMTVYSEPVNPEYPEDTAYPLDMKDALKKILVFVISDTGQGMAPEQIQKLGTEYSRFNANANSKTEGTGLGMNITRNLIKLMNGSISIESTPGMGTTFTVSLPQDCVGFTTIGREMAENLMQLRHDNVAKIRAFQMNRDFMPYGRVLVVDDVETNLYVARGLMAPYGLSIETAMSGFEAIDKVRGGFTYDIIFMDHMMPKMDGIEATKIIRSLGYSKSIVALTANALAGQAAMFLENGFDDFISKPIDIRQLNMVLNKLIRDKYPPEVVEQARKQVDILYTSDENKKTLDLQLAEFFIRDAKKAVTILEVLYLNKCRRGDDISTFIINIHAMKSALANIGETALSADAAKLEQAGREQNIRLILSELPSFLELLHAVIRKLESKEKSGEGTDEVVDNQYLKEKLLAVKEACASYEKKTAKDTLAEIRKKSWPQSVNEKLSDISGYLLHSEFEEAVNFIDGCLKQL